MCGQRNVETGQPIRQRWAKPAQSHGDWVQRYRGGVNGRFGANFAGTAFKILITGRMET